MSQPTLQEHYIRLFEIEGVLNQAQLDVLREDDAEMLRIFEHLVRTQQHYLGELFEDRETVSPEPEQWWHDRCRAEARDAAAAWIGALSEMTDADLDRAIPRRRPEGNFELDGRALLAHVITHSYYHRAQIDWLLRRRGREGPIPGIAYYAQRKVEGEA